MSTPDKHIAGMMTELVAWVKLQNRRALRETLRDLLTTDNDRTVYELTDGTRTGTEVGQQAGVSKSTVSEKWKAWRQASILLDDGSGKGPRHLASIESLGGLGEKP